MPITNIDLEHVTEADLLSLIEDRVAEGILYDYKRDSYEQSSAGKRELLKDVTSFGNTSGGHIIIGMVETGGLPESLVGIDGDLDREKQRLENLCRDCIEPRLVGIRMHAVPLANGRHALLIRVLKSWNPAHAVLFEGRRRYYARNSAGAHEASVEELRAMFTRGATLFDRIREFRRDRVLGIAAGGGPVPLARGGQMILHVVPFSALGGAGNVVDPRQMHGEYLPPLCYSGYTPAYNFDGFLANSGAT